MKDVLSGWREISQYIGKSPSTAQRYKRELRLPVRRHGKGPKAPVYALMGEVDAWLRDAADKVALHSELSQRAGLSASQNQTLQAQVLDRIHTLTDLTLYRRNYYMLFDLKPSRRGVSISIDVQYELRNASNDKQPFIQEITLDDSDHGRVKEISVFKNGAAIYFLNDPPVSQKPLGYSTYRGKELMIEPESSGVSYACRSSWTINRPDEDMWYNHMVLPTLGVNIETKAPHEYEISPSYSISQLILRSEHLDISWRRKK